MSIRNLTKGQRFYKVDAFGVIKIYEYHEPLPKNENYHIFDIQKKRKRTDFEGEVNHLIRSHHRGFVFCRDNVNCPGQVKEEAIKALKALSLDYAGIDIKFNKHNNKAFVLEANSSVGLEGQTLENYTNQIMDICENG